MMQRLVTRRQQLDRDIKLSFRTPDRRRIRCKTKLSSNWNL